MMKFHLKQAISLSLVLSITFAPLFSAYADDYHTYCSKDALATAKELGDQASSTTLTDCASAKVARSSKTVHTVEEVVFIAATVATTALGVIAMTPYGATVSEGLKKSCELINYGTQGAGAAADIALGVINHNVASALASTLATGGMMYITKGSAAADAALAAAKTAATEGVKTAGATEAEKQAGQKVAKFACFGAAVSLGVKSAQYAVGISSDKSTEKDAMNDLKNTLATRSSSGFVVKPTTSDSSKSNSDSVSANKSMVADTACGEAKGDGYLKCLGTTSPEIAALTNDQGFMDTMQKALGGKSLGDFAKNYNGETKGDMAAYVAGGLGLGAGGADAVSKVMDATEKYAKDSGAIDKYTPLAYAGNSSGRTTASVGGDLDFSKMMGDMLKQLSPEDAAKAKDGKLQEMVFRQLDLLPPEKIEGNKEISLFARVGYRYQKKIPDVEKLNSALESGRSVASEPKQ